MEVEQCPVITKKGERCKKPAETCPYHKGTSKSSISKSTPTSELKSKILKKVSPKKTPVIKKAPSLAKLKVMDKHYRGVSEEKCFDALGFERSCAKKYLLDWTEEKAKIPYYKEKIPYPEEFKIVAHHLMEVCKSLISGHCSLHPITPAIQWDNSNENIEIVENKWKMSMHKKGNHYFHEVEESENPVKIFGEEDRFYCMCHETGASDSATKTLLFDPFGDDDKWQELHQDIHVENIDLIPKKNLIKVDGPTSAIRKVTKTLREKIIKDSIDFLGEEFKIHLMPKPEYQIPVLRELIKLLSNDKEFNSHVTAWKAIIPYSRVIDEMKLPSIVIYPVWGTGSAQLVISKIIEHFSVYDADVIGLNITPRFNYKYNELIYWANGAGDQKKLLPVTYFTSSEKIFYIGHEIKFI
jgi:hypothetical protein